MLDWNLEGLYALNQQSRHVFPTETNWKQHKGYRLDRFHEWQQVAYLKLSKKTITHPDNTFFCEAKENLKLFLWYLEVTCADQFGFRGLFIYF